MTAETAALTDVGSERPHNEDAVHAGSIGNSTLLVVADGMGGHRAGDVASQEAIEAFVASLEDRGPGKRDADALVAGVEEANTHLHQMAAENPELEGMGTTLVAALLDGNTATIVNVGDSRAYHVTEENIAQVTTDQSLVQTLVEEGTISPEEADDHPHKNVLSQALGTDETVEPDTYDLTVEGVLLLCSDGVSDEVSETDLHEIVTEERAVSERAEQLVSYANEYDGSDNITVALAEP